MLVFYTETQQRQIEHIYCTGLWLVHNLYVWDDVTVYTLAREYTINDYLYKYWTKFSRHLETLHEANQYQLTFSAYLLAKAPKKTGTFQWACVKIVNFYVAYPEEQVLENSYPWFSKCTSAAIWVL